MEIAITLRVTSMTEGGKVTPGDGYSIEYPPLRHHWQTYQPLSELAQNLQKPWNVAVFGGLENAAAAPRWSSDTTDSD